MSSLKQLFQHSKTSCICLCQILISTTSRQCETNAFWIILIRCSILTESAIFCTFSSKSPKRLDTHFPKTNQYDLPSNLFYFWIILISWSVFLLTAWLRISNRLDLPLLKTTQNVSLSIQNEIFFESFWSSVLFYQKLLFLNFCSEFFETCGICLCNNQHVSSSIRNECFLLDDPFSQKLLFLHFLLQICEMARPTFSKNNQHVSPSIRINCYLNFISIVIIVCTIQTYILQKM